MEYDFYTLGVLYLVYSFAGWVGETVVATVRGKHFANRGAAAGPFCFVYGSTAVLLAVGFTDLRSDPVYLFFACTLASTVMEWLTAKLLERLHRRKWWDYSGKRFNLNGYVCLQYSLLWGVLGTASVLWLNGLLLRLCQVIPSWLLHPLVWAAVIVAALDQIGSAVLVGRYAAKHPVLEQLNQRLGESSDGLRRRIALYVEKRIQRAYPAAARQEPTIAQNGETPLSAADLLWLFVVGAFLGDLVETVFCRLTAGVWMSRSSLVWGPFSVVWGLALVLATVLLRQEKDRSDRYLFAFGTIMGGVYLLLTGPAALIYLMSLAAPSLPTMLSSSLADAAIICLLVFCGLYLLNEQSLDDLFWGAHDAEGTNRNEDDASPATAREEAAPTPLAPDSTTSPSAASSEQEAADTIARLAAEAQLTAREHEVLGLLAEGRSAPFIAEYLSIERSTAKTHVARIYAKLGVHTRQELISLVLSAKGLGSAER